MGEADQPTELDLMRRALEETKTELAAVKLAQVSLGNKQKHDGFRPSRFTGKVVEGGLDVRGWLSTLDQYFELTEAAVEKRATIAALHLDGQARNMVNARMEAQKVMTPGWVMTLDWLKDLLLSAYGSVDPVQDAWNKLQKLRQGSLSVEEYVTAFEQLCAQLGVEAPNEATKIIQFKSGLNSDIRFRCAARPDGQRWTSFKDFVRCCSLNWAVMQQERANRSDVKDSPTNQRKTNSQSSGIAKALGPAATIKKEKRRPYLKKMVGKSNGSGMAIPAAEVKRLMDEGRCLYCKEKGHFARECPQNPQAEKGARARSGSGNA